MDAISVAIPMFWGQVYHWCNANLTRRFLHPEFEDRGRIPEVVITLRHKTTSRCSQRLWQCFRARPIYFHRYQHCPTSDNSIMYKSEVETGPKTGSLPMTQFSEVRRRGFERSGMPKNIAVALEIASIFVSVSKLGY